MIIRPISQRVYYRILNVAATVGPFANELETAIGAVQLTVKGKPVIIQNISFNLEYLFTSGVATTAPFFFQIYWSSFPQAPFGPMLAGWELSGAGTLSVQGGSSAAGPPPLNLQNVLQNPGDLTPPGLPSIFPANGVTVQDQKTVLRQCAAGQGYLTIFNYYSQVSPSLWASRGQLHAVHSVSSLVPTRFDQKIIIRNPSFEFINIFFEAYLPTPMTSLVASGRLNFDLVEDP